MKKTIILVVLLVLTASVFVSCGNKDVEKANVGKFTATTAEGTKVTEGIFKDYDLTMVNIWSLNCGPCITEMPELKKLYKKLPKNVNLVSINLDEDASKESIIKVTGKESESFKTIKVNAEIAQSMLKDVTATPTTLFVNKKGELVGEPHIGVPSGDPISDKYLEIIKERL
ncbi:MAG: TlpA disulfide reductase family protein [Anaerovoracaceae bacterium]